MRFVSSIIWAVLISVVVSYVLSSMAAEPFDIKGTLVLAGGFAVAIFILGEGALKEKEE